MRDSYADSVIEKVVQVITRRDWSVQQVPPLTNIYVMSDRTFPVASKLQSGCEEGKLLPLAIKLQKVNFTDISSDYTWLPFLPDSAGNN